MENSTCSQTRELYQAMSLKKMSRKQAEFRIPSAQALESYNHPLHSPQTHSLLLETLVTIYYIMHIAAFHCRLPTTRKNYSWLFTTSVFPFKMGESRKHHD